MPGSEGGGKRRDKKNHYRRAALLHPQRWRILQLMSDGREAGAGEIAAELDEALARVSYHLRVLVRRRALQAMAMGPPAPARFRWSPHAHWARKMLDEGGEIGGQRP
jgi:DNA-binding transcriptional ArsR family regulator